MTMGKKLLQAYWLRLGHDIAANKGKHHDSPQFKTMMSLLFNKTTDIQEVRVSGSMDNNYSHKVDFDELEAGEIRDLLKTIRRIKSNKSCSEQSEITEEENLVPQLH